ncbi:D-alanyl-D-alanine carboxypeptidase family protein [Bacillaceae bacterium W0354]
MKYKLLTTFIIMSMLLSNIVIFAESNEEQKKLTDSAKSAILMEYDTGEILYNQENHKRLPPASMTKIMTLLLVMEALEKGTITLDEKIRVSEHAASMGGSQVYLEPFEEMTVEDLIKSVAIASANDASVALAERIAVTEEEFVKMMNNKVEELGLENTHFMNSTGLSAKNHYSTAYDMAIMARELLKYENITDYTKIYEDYLRKGTDNEFWLVNTNKLVKFYQGVDGLKTGFTNEAKYCLTATAKRGDMRVIAVVMGADTIKDRNADITNMLDYAFGHYDLHRLYDQDEPLYEWTPLKSKHKLTASPKYNVSLLVEKGASIDDYDTNIIMHKEKEWPINKEEPVGKIEVKKDGEIVAEHPLVITEEIEEASVWTLWKRVIRSIHHGEFTSNSN